SNTRRSPGSPSPYRESSRAGPAVAPSGNRAAAALPGIPPTPSDSPPPSSQSSSSSPGTKPPLPAGLPGNYPRALPTPRPRRSTLSGSSHRGTAAPTAAASTRLQSPTAAYAPPRFASANREALRPPQPTHRDAVLPAPRVPARTARLPRSAHPTPSTSDRAQCSRSGCAHGSLPNALPRPQSARAAATSRGTDSPTAPMPPARPAVALPKPP